MIAAGSGAGRRGFFDAQGSQQFVEWEILPPLCIKRLRPGQEHIENDTQRVHIGARINVAHIGVGLLGTHVPRRPHENAYLSELGLDASLWRDCLRQPEVDDPRSGLSVYFDNQNIGRFQITMDDGFLVGVLHSFAGLNKKFEPIGDLEFVLIAIFVNGQPVDVLHHKVWLALRRGSCVKHLGNRWMIHDGERLPLRLEALYHRLVIHPGLDQLQGHLALDRGSLLREPHLPHAAFTQFSDQLKSLRKHLAGCQSSNIVESIRDGVPFAGHRRRFQKVRI
jgi:hypothetical protein